MKRITLIALVMSAVAACGGGKNSEKDDCSLYALGNYALNLPSYFDFVGSDMTTKGIDKAWEEFESAKQANVDRYSSSLVACGLSDSEVEEELQQITE
jgi:hypothetical protein